MEITIPDVEQDIKIRCISDILEFTNSNIFIETHNIRTHYCMRTTDHIGPHRCICGIAWRDLNG